jgi:uncharacterized protein (TIGR03085 family)
MGIARDEREALCDLLAEVGPDAPTLCEGWLTRDLAAHLILRERRADAAPGILIKPLAGYTRRVQDGYAARPWAELVGLVRSGPPAYWPTAIGAVDELINATEFLVHHEDVRRGAPGWEPRAPEPVRDASAWSGVSRTGRLMLRRSPVGIVLRRPDGAEVTARRGPNTVIITGEPVELLLYVTGREAVRLEFDGEQSSIAAARGLTRGL